MRKTKTTLTYYTFKIILEDLQHIPRTGEQINIYNLLDTDEERRQLNERHKGSLYAVDIVHDFEPDGTHIIDIMLSEECTDVNDFFLLTQTQD